MKVLHFPRMIAVACLMTPLICLASGVRVRIDEEGKLVAKLARTPLLNERAKKELRSGVATRVVILSRLIRLPDRVVAEKLITLSAKYDLWEERFYLRHEPRSGAEAKQSFKTVAQLEEAIEGPGPFEIVPISELDTTGKYRVEMIETIDPLNRERFEAVETWVRQQRLSLRGSAAKGDTAYAAASAESSISALFHSLWKRSAQGEILAGELKRTAESEVFTRAELHRSEGVKPK